MPSVSNRQLQQQIDDFNRLMETINAATPIQKDKSESEKRKRIADTLNDFEKFVYYYFPHYATCKLAKFHIDVAAKLLANKNYKGVEMWARGHAKSVIFNIIIPLYLKAKGEMKVMVLVGKSEDNAKTLLSDLQAELEANQRYINDYGTQATLGHWQDGNFRTADGVAFFARGRGQSPRGLRYRQHRPDYIVIDDLDDDELVRNEKRVRLMVDWILEALLGATDMGRGRFIMVGNKIHKKSCLAKIADIETFDVNRVDVFDKNGQISWPDKYTPEEIAEQRKTLGERRFNKEYFNNPIEEGTVFKEEWIRYEQVSNYKRFRRIVCYIDPSLTGSSGSDYKAAVIIGITQNGRVVILKTFVRRCSINVLVKWLYDQYELANTLNIVVNFYIEGVFAQDYNIRESLRQEAEERGVQFPLRSDMRAKPDKFLRIEGLSVHFENGHITFDAKLEGDTDTKEAIEQLLAFEKGSRTNDDFPDALEGGYYIGTVKHKAHDSNQKANFHQQTRKNRY